MVMTEATSNEYRGSVTGLLNETSNSQYRGAVVGVCDIIYEVLKRHCGPKASHAAWPSISHSGEITDMTFSKDGISIVRKLQFKSESIEECLASSIAYVGTRVDSVCHDGTTTSMMLFTDVIKRLMDKLNGKYTHRQISSAFEFVLKGIQGHISENSFMPDSLAEELDMPVNKVRRAIAYSQAYIASKGNKELSGAIADLAEKVPIEKLYGQYVRDVKRTETDIAFEVHKDSDFACDVFLNTPQICNDLFKTEYENESVDVIVSENILSPNTGMHDDLEQMLKAVREFRHLDLDMQLSLIDKDDEEGIKAVKDTYKKKKKAAERADAILKGDRDLIIVAPGQHGNLQTAILNHNSQMVRHGYRQIGLFSLQNENEPSKRMFMRVFQILARNGEYVYLPGDVENSIIKDIKVKYYGRKILEFSNFNVQGDDPIYHPWFVDMDNAPINYQITIKELEKEFDKYTSTHQTTSLNEMAYKDYLILYRYMICKEQYSLQIGGSTHDARAMLSVVDDAYGAVVSALTNGIIFDGLSNIGYSLKQSVAGLSGAEKIVAENLLDSVSEILGNVSSVSLVHYRPDCYSPFNQAVYNIETDAVEFIHSTEAEPDVKAVICDAFESESYEKLLMQPIIGYNELFKRIQELVPKYLSTTTFLNSYDVRNT